MCIHSYIYIFNYIYPLFVLPAGLRPPDPPARADGRVPYPLYPLSLPLSSPPSLSLPSPPLSFLLPLPIASKTPAPSRLSNAPISSQTPLHPFP